MSCRREATTNAFSCALSPAMKREFFHASKYSDIVGVITTSAVNASCVVGLPLLRGRVELLGLVSKCSRRGEEDATSGTASPNSTLPSPSRSAFTSFAVKAGWCRRPPVSTR